MQEMRPQDGDLLQKIEQAYKTMSKGQKQIARYILENYDKAAFVTASKMGSVVGVSESTVVRFAYALGYDGYPELQRSLQEFIRNKLTSVQRIQLTDEIDQGEVLNTVLKADMNNIRATIESVDPTSFEQVVEGLIQAKNVYIVGTRASTPLVEFFGYYLNFVLDGVHAVTSGTSDVFDQLIRVSAEDVVLGISCPRYSSRTLEGMRFAKERGAKVYAITDSQLSPLAETADITLFARSDMVSFADSLVAPMALINAVIVALSMRKKDEVSARFAQLEGIWHKNRVYAGRENG